MMLQTAASLRKTEDLREAAEVMKLRWNCSLIRRLVRKVDPTHNEAKMKLAEVYEILDEPRKALDLLYEVIDPRQGDQRGRRYRPERPLTNPRQAAKPCAKAKMSHNRLPNMELRALEAKKEGKW
ncbi:hypothetical protein FB451DRAFT_1173034 [Mycena latifolia]|nr:hypothetical protein FB451DRAFT_1173034 [Mycena latifolia]